MQLIWRAVFWLPTFTPDGNQIWTSVRGESYISIIDVGTMKEIKRVNVANGPGMVAFTPDGKLAYVCSSFTPEVDIVNTRTYTVVKKIAVISPFSPNIFTSPDGRWVAMTHKDVGKVTVISTQSESVVKILNTGAITNHVTFTETNGKLLMLVTVGGENKVRIFDPGHNFIQVDTINVGALPHGIWPSADGKTAYIGLEYGDEVQRINLENMTASAPVKIGQSPQALVYADRAVVSGTGKNNLSPLDDSSATQVVNLLSIVGDAKARGRLAVRPIGLADLVEQIFTNLKPNTPFVLALTKSAEAPYRSDYEINRFQSDGTGRYVGQSTGLVKSVGTAGSIPGYKHIILLNAETNRVVMLDTINSQ